MKNSSNQASKLVKTYRSLATALVLLTALALTLTQIHASKPVRRKQTGCVINKSFINTDGYLLRLYYRKNGERDRKEETQQMFDLSSFEGRMLVLEGRLHPGDRYTLDGKPHDVGSCPPEILKQMVKELLDRCCGTPIVDEDKAK